MVFRRTAHGGRWGLHTGWVAERDPEHRHPHDLPRPSLRHGVRQLSEREQEILEWLPTHLSNAEIGRQVHMSVNTVKSHLKGIYAALGARSRSEAVAAAERLGLLDQRCPMCGRGAGPSAPDGRLMTPTVRRAG